jgi:hypothetical protein
MGTDQNGGQELGRQENRVQAKAMHQLEMAQTERTQPLAEDDESFLEAGAELEIGGRD